MTDQHALTRTETQISTAASERLGVRVNVFRDGGWICEPKAGGTGLTLICGSATSESAIAEFAKVNAALLKGLYVVAKVEGHAMSMSTLKMSPTVHAVVKFSKDGMIAWTGPSYYAGHEPRNMMAQAGAMRTRYQGHFDRTGERWEVSLANERMAKKAAKDAIVAARRATRERAGDLFAALVAVSESAGEFHPLQQDVPISREIIMQVRAAIEGLSFPAIPE